MGFPRGDYTPFGLVANPWAYARSWTEGYGGTLRTTEQRPGLAWCEPWATRPRRACLLEIGFEREGRRSETRDQFAALGLAVPHHSARLLEFCWQHGGLIYTVTFFLYPACLAARWRVANPTSEPVSTRLIFSQGAWRADDQVPESWERSRVFLPGRPRGPSHRLALLGEFGPEEPERLAGRPGFVARARNEIDVRVPPADEAAHWVGLSPSPYESEPEWRPVPTDLLPREPTRGGPDAYEDLLRAQDDAFWATCPQLSGDWPREFRNGLVYDFETTRMCLQPAGGIFKDVWPAWMVNWPRAVLAEGTLDMLRLSFAQPELAQRGVLSLFRDAPAPNVPCVFKHGEPNMVAADGSICGTSPAWCVPFHNLRRLYLRTLDRSWLTELYPCLAAYVRWWLANRSDENGWTVYKCTWEAGEDNSPRLDPDREGDHVISRYARPVELQAAMADAAATLAFFAAQVGATSDLPGWMAVEQAARERVQRLWDGREGRFRDWDVRRNGFIEPTGQDNYWGADPRRFSPLALTPLLFGQAAPEQTAALRREIEHYSRPPWSNWPSWSYVVLEAASRVGWYDFAGRMAYAITRRVYTENDRRDLSQFERPIPGAAREYWPSDLSTWDASEGYGWGATTASFVIRQLCGFYEAEEPNGYAFRLAPALPRELIDGRELRLGPLPYRGRLLSLAYRGLQDGALEVEVGLDESALLRVVDERSREVPRERVAAGTHNFQLLPGRVVRVELPG